MLQEFRDQLDLAGTGYLLTIAAPGGPSQIANLELPDIADSLDWINVMSYDFHGMWESTTGFNAALYPAADSPFTDEAALNVDAAIQAYLDAGISPDQIVMGAPIYGRGWGNVPATDDGLFQTGTGSPGGTWEEGVFDYADLTSHYIGQGDWTRYWHSESQVPWLYSASEQIMISYDDEESIDAKLDYIIDYDLGGVMFWELSADTSSHTITDLMADRLRP